MNIPLDEWSGAGATKALHKAISEYHVASGKQAAIMIRLTWAIIVLTVALLIGLIIQIILAL